MFRDHTGRQGHHGFHFSNRGVGIGLFFVYYPILWSEQVGIAPPYPIKNDRHITFMLCPHISFLTCTFKLTFLVSCYMVVFHSFFLGLVLGGLCSGAYIISKETIIYVLCLNILNNLNITFLTYLFYIIIISLIGE